MQIPREPAFLPVFHSDSTKQPDHNDAGVLLANGVTYYVPFGGEASPLQDVHVQWDAAIILTSIEVEYACNPAPAVFSAVVGEWVKTNAVGPFSQVDAVGGGVPTALTVAVAGGTVGGCNFHLIMGSRRGRLKVVVGGTGGRMKFTTNGKA